ncbi:MAG: single-stranded-DNA-specific exonuclease RecJ [Oscillospiraceae bacterium]|nr:single-stranded-DNA-specific exonuclease RecJ [Oscillospiraceae bacterium]
MKKWIVKKTDRSFLNDCAFYDPFLLKDMDKAVELIRQTLTRGGKITVYGDYDCDGITATVMLYEYLIASGGEADWYIPSREEGYGLNPEVIELLARNGTELIITVDNGVTAVKEALLIKEKGIDLIITDHHTPLDELPEAYAIINPKQGDCDYPFRELAGCGVVLKLICALENSDIQSVIEQYGDLAAIGTIGDIVPLVDENRLIVSAGLEGMECSENLGLYCLMKQAGLIEKEGKSIDSTTVAYIICPRINAAGRFSHPKKAAELLLCENTEVALSKATELNVLNSQRSEEEAKIIAEIEALLLNERELLNQRVLVLCGENWHHGIIGIIASKMMNRFGKPCVVISYSSDDSIAAKGSCRSVKGFSVHEMLKFCGDLLTRFGGHAGAGGLSVLNENINELKQRIYKFAEINHDVMPVIEIVAEEPPLPCDITIEKIEETEAFQPFGEGNPALVYYLPDCVIKHKRPLKEGRYTAFRVDYKGMEFKILDFSPRPYVDFWYSVGDYVDLIVTFGVSEYNGVTEVSLKMLDMRLSKINQERYFAARDAYERIKRNEEIDKALLTRIIPDDVVMKKAYDIIKKSFCLDEIIQKGMVFGINYCMMRIIIDVFSEMGLVEFNPVSGDVKLSENIKKIDLSESAILEELKKKI